MPRLLPPLKQLRTFEAAARHLSFTRAAEELGVTQAAVSHQIKTLEDQLGLPLFRRLKKTLLLTDAGQTLFPAVSAALDDLADALEHVRAQDAGGVLNITTLPSIATKWLVPKLGRFRRRHPDIDVRLSTDYEIVDLERTGYDLAIRYGKGEWPGCVAWPLLQEEMSPVCSPSLLEGDIPLDKPEDLARHTLLQDAGIDWRLWFEAADVRCDHPERGPWFLDSGLAVQAAVEGQGVLLGRSTLVADDLASGRLVKPFDISLPAEYAYYVVCPRARADRPKIKAFVEWIRGEVAGPAIAAP
ncbi:transcriptional regulator GcvA [Varunaivibrio sulfuroxidans]|uniref:LysR family transcriptional regulator n=1 Tax=Varunaivibrio sulfuroxidans TaxID=1773489 RepID=A0A4R3JFA4_9PROT|nr:transcriptional regulator GcvA [Varunaivibrio sulfuroxidans]TCS64778.1 LysR family transcriptional regulator [Varunaivibrio sulfuroxidans]WES29917.1 transcriptional regulator GcvA [Varunaivibrio sulfuroxidans]